MAVVVLQCSCCQKKFGVLDHQLGHSVACSHCGHGMMTAAPATCSSLRDFLCLVKCQPFYRFAASHRVVLGFAGFVLVMAVVLIADKRSPKEADSLISKAEPTKEIDSKQSIPKQPASRPLSSKPPPEPAESQAELAKSPEKAKPQPIKPIKIEGQLSIVDGPNLGTDRGFFVWGEIRNDGDKVLRHVSVLIAVYNFDDFVGTTRAQTDYLEPGATWKFEASARKWGAFMTRTKIVEVKGR